MLNRRYLLLLVLSLFLFGCRLADWLAEGTPYPTPRGTRAPTVAARTATPTPSTVVPATPLAPATSANLPVGPSPISPLPGSTFFLSDRVQLGWTWIRPLNPGEYYDVQVSKDTPNAFVSVGCTINPSFSFAPTGVGTFTWRIAVRRGSPPPNCAAQGDSSQPGQLSVFVVRAGGTAATATPPRPAPSATAPRNPPQPSPTVPRTPYP